MREIKAVLTEELSEHCKDLPTARAAPYNVTTFRELVVHVARLAYRNKDYLLFYRGQPDDIKNKAGASTFYPRLYRQEGLTSSDVDYRFRLLEQMGRSLAEAFEKNNTEGRLDIRRKAYVRWSILQHYQIADTPLIDLTHSIHVACSFAQYNNDSNSGYFYVFGLPYVTNRISFNSEHDIINVRLLSICPPSALRPYFQEGYLAGTTDVTSDYQSKSELDFNRRLVAKFKIPSGEGFWNNGSYRFPNDILYPPNDQIESLCNDVKANFVYKASNEEIGRLITTWTAIEKKMNSYGIRANQRTVSAAESIRILYQNEVIDENEFKVLNKIRIFRNDLMHKG